VCRPASRKVGPLAIRGRARPGCAAALTIGSRAASSVAAVIRQPAWRGRLRLMIDIPRVLTGLEVVTQRKLNHARFATNCRDHAEVRIVDVEIGILEVNGIEDVEKLCAELDVLMLSEARTLEHAEVSAEEARTGERSVRQAA